MISLRSLIPCNKLCHSTAANTLLSDIFKSPVFINVQVREANRSCIRDLRKDFNWKRERPLGPHMHKPPNKAGVRAAENYRHIIHYPEDGKYTIKKLDG